MRWQDERRSTNVEDRRGFPVRGAGVVGGGAILVALVATLLGAPPGLVRAILGGGADDETATQTTSIECPRKQWSSRPFSTSQSRMVRS